MSQADHFELFGLARGFEVDPLDLEQRWKERASAVHPDRFANASESEKRVAMQWSAAINEGYRVLRDPLRRAQYLCELAGHPVENQSSGAMDVVFLSQQMQWREMLEDIRASADADALKGLAADIEADRQRREADTAKLIAKQQWGEVVERLREWMFVEKFLEEIVSTQRALKTQNL
ncbi:Fe-S protein assembly co-chaperone HscB [Orrella daihaiensis]|uniref:Co-chaperone protein HscB homolog n=1 Tax=Orrella daihaiensis TaxID=2782176 RepID=A0ABY4AMM0_9BURK|nr:Fe-S protein assembly co-chaperone HscB [Orrella daihaiensis]UOD49279.1 Fe-S protein assembly co-chaperone HscB [Orrella daihaiensis]